MLLPHRLAGCRLPQGMGMVRSPSSHGAVRARLDELPIIKPSTQSHTPNECWRSVSDVVTANGATDSPRAPPPPPRTHPQKGNTGQKMKMRHSLQAEQTEARKDPVPKDTCNPSRAPLCTAVPWQPDVAVCFVC